MQLTLQRNSTKIKFQTVYIFILKVKDSEGEKVKEFFKLNDYLAGSYDKTQDFKNLNTAIEQKGSSNRLFYMALPPSVFEQVTLNIKAVCMSKG